MHRATVTAVGLALALALASGPARSQQAAAPGGACEIQATTGPARCSTMKEQAACVALAKESSALYRWTPGRACPAPADAH